MSLSKRIDVLDFIISILLEHEKKFSSLVDRLESLCLELRQDPFAYEHAHGHGADRNEPNQGLRSGGRSILLVDDDESVKTILQDEGYTEDTAATGQEAIEKAENNKYDLAILDVKLPDMMGYEVAHTLMERDDEIYIILITGYPAFRDLINELDPHITNVLLKPVENDRLLYVARRVLQCVG
ncbi:MAG: response regulator [Candidatus Bathyarchaeia archaeon]